MRIFDCFSIFNELDTVELRLAEMYNIVDKFIITEATTTHAGKSKPMYFSDNLARYDRWKDKIQLVVIGDMPAGADHWEREKHQRNSITRVLRANSNDLIVISDCDEIPRASQFDYIKLGNGQVGNLIMRSFQYYYNLEGRTPWVMGKILNYSTFKTFSSASDVRAHAGSVNIPNGGWHMSYMGGYEKIREKLMSFAHQEFNQPDYIDLEKIKIRVESGLPPWGDIRELEYETPTYWQRVDLDCSFPAYLRENWEKFKHALL